MTWNMNFRTPPGAVTEGGNSACARDVDMAERLVCGPGSVESLGRGCGLWLARRAGLACQFLSEAWINPAVTTSCITFSTNAESCKGRFILSGEGIYGRTQMHYKGKEIGLLTKKRNKKISHQSEARQGKKQKHGRQKSTIIMTKPTNIVTRTMNQAGLREVRTILPLGQGRQRHTGE